MIVTLPAQDPFPGQASVTCLGLALAAVASTIRVFGDELVNFRRESESGLSTEAYCASAACHARIAGLTSSADIGKSLAHIPTEVLAPLMFTMFYYAISLPEAPFYEYFLVYFSVGLMHNTASRARL